MLLLSWVVFRFVRLMLIIFSVLLMMCSWIVCLKLWLMLVMVWLVSWFSCCWR